MKRATHGHLFLVADQPEPKPEWHGRHDLERHGEPGDCPDCGMAVHVDQNQVAVRALFWMHGFGASIRTTWVSCLCGYRRHWKTETITPRTDAA